MHQAASAAAELGRGGNVTVGTIQGYTVEELVEQMETQRRRADVYARLCPQATVAMRLCWFSDGGDAAE